MDRHKPETRAAYRAAHREEILAYARKYNRQYYLAHREKLLAKHKEWQKQTRSTEEYKAKHQESRRKYEREYYRKHREKLIAKSKERQQRYINEHREEMRARWKERYHAHREEILLHQKAWRCGVNVQDITPTPGIVTELKTSIINQPIVGVEPPKEEIIENPETCRRYAKIKCQRTKAKNAAMRDYLQMQRRVVTNQEHRLQWGWDMQQLRYKIYQLQKRIAV